MHSRQRFVPFAALALAFAAFVMTSAGCGKTNQTATTGTSTQPATPGLTDASIAAAVMTANTVDIDAGRQALSRSSNKDVQGFAQRMIDDHTAANQKATDLGNKLNLTPEPGALSQQIQTEADSARAAMANLSGAAFDQAYIANEVKVHQQVIGLLDQTLIPSAQNEELKAMLQQARPVLQSHLEHAQRVQGTVGMPQ